MVWAYISFLTYISQKVFFRYDLERPRKDTDDISEYKC